MTTWRPHPGIRVKALGLNWRGNRLLAAEVLDDAGRVKGVRPLGGTVEFGETAKAAVMREFKEELGIDVEAVGHPFFIENLFSHEGSPGHEILILFDVVFKPEAFLDEERIQFREDNGTICHAEWFDIECLDQPDSHQLFPTGLRPHLISRSTQDG
ncbi:MAG: NUDIX domain-containing protein [Silicimonas sp.]|nr:NUDIX domain-containing protein [Silicimonas sp.]